LAEVVGMSPTSVQRIWGAFGLQPWRAETFNLSTDPLFIEKFKEVVGLYLYLPERRFHDYTGHGTTSLFALSTLDGTAITSLHKRHRAIEFKKVPRTHRRRGAGEPTSTSSPTTTPRTRPQPSSCGWRVIRDSNCTSSPQARAGSTSSSGGSPS
jgi:hypothetical protein